MTHSISQIDKAQSQTRALFKYCAEARQGKSRQIKAQIVEILAYFTCRLKHTDLYLTRPKGKSI